MLLAKERWDEKKNVKPIICQSKSEVVGRRVIAMPLVNGNCVVNSAHYEDLSDFRSCGRCAKINRTKNVDWEGLAMGQYSIFFSP